jgi:hypothetical protein
VIPPYLPYTGDSFYKSPVKGAPVDATATSVFHAFMASFAAQRGTHFPTINGLGSSRWGTVYAHGAAADPIWKLTGTLPQGTELLRTTGFHAPAWLGAQLTGTSDSPFCVMDTASGFTMFGGRAKLAGPRTISVGSAGITYHSSNGLDAGNPRSSDHRNSTSRGRISDAMVIRRDLVDHAIANNTGLGHVLHLFMVETNSAAGYCHPMTGCESGKAGFGAEGLRVALAPGIDLTKRGLSPFGLAVARTLQQHGAYSGDNAGSAASLKAEQGSASRNPWRGLTVAQDALKGIAWTDMVVLPRGWQ